MTGWDGFAKYVGVQGILALMITLAIIILLIMSKLVPVELWAMLTLTYGFYFAKNGYAIVKSGVVQYPKVEE